MNGIRRTAIAACCRICRGNMIVRMVTENVRNMTVIKYIMNRFRGINRVQTEQQQRYDTGLKTHNTDFTAVLIQSTFFY